MNELDSQLIEAVKAKNIDKVKNLLFEGADIDSADENYYTPLHWAAYNNDIEMVKFLIKEGADIYFSDKSGQLALDYAKEKNYLEIIKILQDRELLDLELIDKIKNRDFKASLHLLKQGASINILDEEGFSPLHYASYNGDIRTIEILLENGADVQLQDADGLDALGNAREGGNQTAIALLEDYIKQKEIDNILIEAVKSKNSEKAKILLLDGADINAEDKLGFTPLHWAIINGDIEMVKFLLKEDADIYFDIPNTALNFAKLKKQTEIAKILEERAQMDAKLIQSVKTKNIEDIQYLLAQGASVNCLDEEGFSPLHYASYNGDIRIIEILLENGADIQLQDADGLDALGNAREGGNQSAVTFLQSALEHYCDGCNNFIPFQDKIAKIDNSSFCLDCIEEDEDHVQIIKPKVQKVWKLRTKSNNNQQ